ncbi:outer membrane beta-barrel protein [Marinoscillum sp.]|uniref:outer membrane beta-barrel protein n=1 Tax=Marinoscillum sp. TaxID=2024838 RepID=UPI003BABF40A
MTPNVLSSGSRLLIVGILLLIANVSVAQRSAPPSTFESFLNTQWWLGLRFGLNYTQPVASEDYYIFSPLDYDAENLQKTYDVFNLGGGQAGLDLSFYHKGISIGLQPTFKIMRYSYSNYFEWLGSGDADRLETAVNVEQSIQVIEVPLIVKYEILKRGKVRPFVLAGLQQSFVINAQKKAEVMHTDYLADVPQTYSGGDFSIGNTDRMSNFFGALGGIGTSLDYANIRTVIEITYLYGLSPITANGNPFSENELVGIGDVNDQLKINNLNAAISFVFPLRYIDKTFQPY